MTRYVAVAIVSMLFVLPSALASHTPPPTAVTVAGSLQSELGCSDDWQPACTETRLAPDADDGVWQATFTVPAGSWEYKAPLNGDWAENYGANAARDGANIPLELDAATAVKFYYDHATHWITSNRNAVIATVAGSFQSQLGCPGDWAPDCLRSWLQDPDGDGTYAFETDELAPGDYEAKVTIGESWGENYGAGGVPNGPNIPFSVSAGDRLRFEYDAVSHVLTIGVVGEPAQPSAVAIPGSFGVALGCSAEWMPTCPSLAYDASDRVWQGSYDVPAGSWEYKAALNGSWDENYGANATRSGPNIGLVLDAPRRVKFYYSHATHWITSDANSVIATVPGNFQSELGCPGDWQPDCLRSWLQDADGDGIYSFDTDRLPAGTYEAKVALRESWDENYGLHGVRNGANIPFTVHEDGAVVRFTYDAGTHVLTIDPGEAPASATNRSPGDVEWNGLRHDSRDTLYRAPGGSVPTGTPVTLRLRTLHDDVTSVRARVFDVGANAERLVEMELAASDVDCYDDALASQTCDFWETTVSSGDPNVLWYRFVVADGGDTDYYADDTAALDGGAGAVTDGVRDWSYALTVHTPAFSAPAWARDAVVYQIFPDRFRNGNPRNDPQTGDVRYDDPVIKLPWSELPEGYCRHYEGASGETCPWRFDDTPPDWSPEKEGPRGRDYFGGDLRGVTEKLDYIRSLGVTAIYFNPIFAAKSNHRYDTANYRQVDPYLGTLKEFRELVAAAEARGIRVILDGVFNHMSSDSPLFDRYHHYDEVGACESLESPFRPWFVFTSSTVPCGTGDYVGWFGFDSIPQLEKTNPDVVAEFVTAPNSITRRWLKLGVGGWRMDVSSDPSFPNGYWETFRGVVKGTSPDALTIAEAWQKDSTTLRSLAGDRFDSTMNYRQRDAILGYLSPHASFDSKGFADGGRQLAPSEAAARLESIREDYPDAAYFSLLNLLDSHDTERILWSLTPGPETRAGREHDAANVAEGKRRQRLASLLQFTLPGMPSVYYGDEVAVTGDDDPDDRRTYPWADTGGVRDDAMLAHYRALSQLRSEVPALRRGGFEVVAADDSAGALAWLRKTPSAAALVAVNRGNAPASVPSPLASCELRYVVGTASYEGASLRLGPLSAAVCTAAGDFDPPAAPRALARTGEGNGTASLTWAGVDGAAAYRVYRSPVSGGGYVLAGATSGTSFADSGLGNGVTYHYVVRAVDGAGNESGDSNEVTALPHLTIGWSNLQHPPSMSHTISTINRTPVAYGQVWIDGVTGAPGPTESLRAELGFGPDGSDPAGNAAWTWVPASFNVDAGSNDEFKATLRPDALGSYDYAFRYTTTNGREWVYADLDGSGNGYSTAHAGELTVTPASDTAAPPAPANLRKVTAGPTRVELAWDGAGGDTWGYEVRRAAAAGGPYETLGLVRSAQFADTTVEQGRTYFYVVRAVDLFYNRSPHSNEVAATAEVRMVSVVFTVTVPEPVEDAVGKTVYVAGTLHRLSPPGPEWNPGGQALVRLDDTHWRVTLSGLEGTQLEYKYTLGSWDYVEKGPGSECAELTNRQLTIDYGASGVHEVSDTVANWRNVTPCGG